MRNTPHFNSADIHSRRHMLRFMGAGSASFIAPAGIGLLITLSGNAEAGTVATSSLSTFQVLYSKHISTSIPPYKGVEIRTYSEARYREERGGKRAYITRRIVTTRMANQSLVSDMSEVLSAAFLTRDRLETINQSNGQVLTTISTNDLDTGSDCRSRRLSLLASMAKRALPIAHSGFRMVAASQIWTEAIPFYFVQFTATATATFEGYRYIAGQAYVMGWRRDWQGALVNTFPIPTSNSRADTVMNAVNTYNSVLGSLKRSGLASLPLAGAMIVFFKMASEDPENNQVLYSASLAALAALTGLGFTALNGPYQQLMNAAQTFESQCFAVGFPAGDSHPEDVCVR